MAQGVVAQTNVHSNTRLKHPISHRAKGCRPHTRALYEYAFTFWRTAQRLEGRMVYTYILSCQSVHFSTKRYKFARSNSEALWRCVGALKGIEFHSNRDQTGDAWSNTHVADHLQCLQSHTCYRNYPTMTWMWMYIQQNASHSLEFHLKTYYIILFNDVRNCMVQHRWKMCATSCSVHSCVLHFHETRV